MSTQRLENPELASVDVEEVDRSSFLVKGAIAAGALYGVGAVGPMVARAFAQDNGGDVEILNFALTLEYLEAAYYDEALKNAKLSGEASDVAKEIGDNEQAHVDALTQTIEDLGGKPAEAPKVDFGNAFASEKAFLELAQTFEDTGVSAYNGAGPSLKSKDLLATAGGIVQVEARHAARIRLLNDQLPSPVAFDEALGMNAVLKAVQPFVKS